MLLLACVGVMATPFASGMDTNADARRAARKQKRAKAKTESEDLAVFAIRMLLQNPKPNNANWRNRVQTQIDNLRSTFGVNQQHAVADEFQAQLDKIIGSGADKQKQEQEQIIDEQSTDYYKVLGIENTASPEEIRSAYKKLALKWHPDRWAGASDEEKDIATEKFKEISNAYTALYTE